LWLALARLGVDTSTVKAGRLFRLRPDCSWLKTAV
jgi:hypothetical protein